MRITGETFNRPATGSPSSSGRLPRDLSAAWATMAGAGAVVIGLVAGRDDALAVVAGAGLLAGGSFLLGRRVVRDDPRVAALTEQRDRARLEVIRLTGDIIALNGELQRMDGTAAAPRREDEPAATAAARPSASVRGGGRPGRAGALAAVPSLDAPLDAADGALS